MGPPAGRAIGKTLNVSSDHSGPLRQNVPNPFRANPEPPQSMWYCRQAMNTAQQASGKARLSMERHIGTAALILLLLGCAAVLLPFASALVWATVLSFSSWPIYTRLLRAVGGRAFLAAL